MDESYLDSLLNEFSLDKEIDNKIEDELDEQIQSEKDKYQEERTVSREEAFNYDLEQDAGFGVPESDLDFSEDQIDELDNLDNLADLDIGDLDFSDIDFDDLDITKLSGDIYDSDFDELLKDFEGNLEIPSLNDEDDGDQNIGRQNDEQSDSQDNSVDGESLTMDSKLQVGVEEEQKGEVSEDIDGTANEVSSNDEIASDDSSQVSGDLNEDNFDADSFLDSLLSEDSIEETDVQEISDESASDSLDSSDGDSDSLDDLLGGEQSEEKDAQLDGAGESMEDDLLSMLDLQENEGGNGADGLDEGEAKMSESNDNSSSGEHDVSTLEGLDDIEDISSEKPKKKKRSLMEILFGEPDEDDEPTEEEIRAKEEKKAAKKAKKEADKEKKKEQADKDKEEKSKKDADKKQKNEEKKRIKAEKKAKRKAEDAAEAAKEKKLNKPAVIFIFSILIGGVGFLYLSSIDFNYKIAIQQAASYFANQKYHKAYDEIKGVDVKEKDKPLKDRIYTVMYVERLYESYENNIELGRNKKALDSLLRGVSKYYEYYDDAQELDIVSDLDFSFAQIKNALEINYGIDLNRAMEINELDDYEYMKTIREYTDSQEE